MLLGVPIFRQFRVSNTEFFENSHLAKTVLRGGGGGGGSQQMFSLRNKKNYL